MKSDTQILNEIASKSPYLHKLSEQESKLMKRMLLIMYKDIAKLCEQNQLTYMLGGGSCLGAIRHKGFIPWDDDLDLMMPRRDYEELINLCKQGTLGDKYEYNTPDKKKDSKNPYLKIYRRDTLDNELYNENTPFPKGIFIDIFPMDYTPKNLLHRNIKGFISDLIMGISTSVLYAEYPSEKYKEFVSSNKDSKRRYNLRLTIGKIFKIIPHRTWVYWFDRLNAITKKTDFMTIPTGRKHYIGETQPMSTFLPVSYGDFEGIKCPIPANSHEYLKSLYGDYMSLPPEEKRERHFVYQFKCNLPS